MRYNLTAYNRGEIRETPVESNAVFTESLHVDLSKTIAIESEVQFSEKVNVRPEASRALVQEVAFSESLKSETSTVLAIGNGTEFAAKILAQCSFGKEMAGSETFSESLKANTNAGKDMKELVLLSDQLMDNAELAKLIFTRISFWDNLEMLSNAASSSEEITTISVELMPGDTLEIDSEFYTVDLNGENAFDIYNGEWVYLSRDVADVVISANGIGLEAEILYRARYL